MYPCVLGFYAGIMMTPDKVHWSTNHECHWWKDGDGEKKWLPDYVEPAIKRVLDVSEMKLQSERALLPSTKLKTLHAVKKDCVAKEEQKRLAAAASEQEPSEELPDEVINWMHAAKGVGTRTERKGLVLAELTQDLVACDQADVIEPRVVWQAVTARYAMLTAADQSTINKAQGCDYSKGGLAQLVFGFLQAQIPPGGCLKYAEQLKLDQSGTKGKELKKGSKSALAKVNLAARQSEFPHCCYGEKMPGVQTHWTQRLKIGVVSLI
jgi:hypothetical protein